MYFFVLSGYHSPRLPVSTFVPIGVLDSDSPFSQAHALRPVCGDTLRAAWSVIVLSSDLALTGFRLALRSHHTPCLQFQRLTIPSTVHPICIIINVSVTLDLSSVFSFTPTSAQYPKPRRKDSHKHHLTLWPFDGLGLRRTFPCRQLQMRAITTP